MFRFETLALTALLSAPVVALWWRGDFTDTDMGTRLLWCLLAAWCALALLRWAAVPREPVSPHEPPADGSATPDDDTPPAN